MKFHDIDDKLIENRQDLLSAFLCAVDLVELLDPEREHAKELNIFDELITKIMDNNDS